MQMFRKVTSKRCILLITGRAIPRRGARDESIFYELPIFLKQDLSFSLCKSK